MLIELDEFVFGAVMDRVKAMQRRITELEVEVQGRMMKPINDRQGATVGGFTPPIDVDLNRIGTNEGRLAAATIMHSANRTMEFLNKEIG
mgnify:CR=1 FL=1